MGCKACKGLSSLTRCDQVTQLKAPLDSAAIYPITRSLNKHLETGKKENLARPYLCLAHPAWSWWQRFKLHSSRNASLDHCCFVKTHNLLPHTPLWDSFIKEHLHMSIITKWTPGFKHMIFSRCLSWTCPSQPWWPSPLDVILSRAIWNLYFWCKPMKRYLTNIDSIKAHI